MIAVPEKVGITRPEILAPAGNEEMMKAAVENGADAVYFGLHQFNARLRATNFDARDLPRLVGWLHERGVKAYVTLNTLIFCDEMEMAAELLATCSSAGVDAVLVQDLGLAWLARQMVPDLPLHASTQMTLTSAESIAAIEQFGINIDRVVAARELSVRDLEKITRATDKEIEVFVHGAICVAYSGQCLTSEALGGRSANRGECAQACRLPYDLIVDGENRDLGDVKYLLSPRDLAAYEDIGALVRNGIVSLKIEGRYKSPEYVAATVQSYRAAVDEALRQEGIVQDPSLDERTRRKLEQTFSRGFTGGYLHAIDHQAVVEGRYPKKRGLYLGRVTGFSNEGIEVGLEGPLKIGDGVVFDGGRPQEDEEGGRVYHLLRDGRRVESFEPLDQAKRRPHPHTLVFGPKAIRRQRINIGDRVWKTSDPALDAELRASYAGDHPHHRRPVNAIVIGEPGKPLRLTLTDERGISITVEDTESAQPAQNRPLTREVLEQQIGRMGNTPFVLGTLEFRASGGIMVPFSRLNELRRRAVDKIIEHRRALHKSRNIHDDRLTALRLEILDEPRREIPPASDSKLSVLCRTLEQVKAAAAHPGVSTVYTDFEDLRLHATAREIVTNTQQRFIPATLRIMKPGEGPLVRKLLDAKPDGILVRNLASWHVIRQLRPELPVIGDFALNVSNDLAAALHRRHGLELLTPSYDLNFDQLVQLLTSTPPEWYEVTIHQYMPMFHMEHCVFCRFLSDGTDFTNCGRPCETHQIALRDRMGYEHRVKADMGCRNTVFNAVAQSASAYVGGLLSAGVRNFRIDLLDEDAAAARETINGYLPAIRGEADGRDLWKRLRARGKLGVTRGSFDQG